MVWHIRVCQGWSENARVDSALAMTRWTPESPDFQQYIVHGTFPELVDGILLDGLIAGGRKHFASARSHIHFATQLADEGKTAGVRDGTNRFVWLDAKDYLDKGGVLYKSQNSAILTEGFDAGPGKPGIVPPSFIVKITTRNFGEVIYERDVNNSSELRERHRMVDMTCAEAEQAETFVLTQADMEKIRQDEQALPDAMAQWKQREKASVEAQRKREAEEKATRARQACHRICSCLTVEV